jgi:hypothetical protein
MNILLLVAANSVINATILISYVAHHFNDEMVCLHIDNVNSFGHP